MHTIRLRGPWEYLPLARFVAAGDGPLTTDTADLPPGGRIQLPGNWTSKLGDFVGRVRFTRFFNRPTGLENGEVVWLVVEPPQTCGAISLNGRDLGTVAGGQPPARFDVSPWLLDRNKLIVEVECPKFTTRFHEPSQSPAGGMVGEVRLEMELPQW